MGAIRAARILPSVADQLRASARAGTVHYSNLIEGNELPYIEAERATRGDLPSDTRAKIELVNYVAALDLLDARLAAGKLAPDSSLILELHALVTRGLGREEDPHFRPQHEGHWRDGRAVVVDHLSGQVMHEGPQPEQVPGLMEAMTAWLGKRLSSTSEQPFALAGVAHYAITDIHPFADGNGRTARLFQTAVLMAADVLPGRMFSFESYYASDRAAYYGALRSVRRNTYNMEQWLEYFLAGLAGEYERVAATVADLGTLMPGGGANPLQLTTSQQTALTTLRIAGVREFTRRDYQEAAAVGRSVAGKEIAALVRHGVLVPRGSGNRTRYAFAPSDATHASAASAGPGRRAVWTDERIERELREFLGDRSTWPPHEEFKAAGRRDLYAAASRSGGVRRWRRLVGF